MVYPITSPFPELKITLVYFTLEHRTYHADLFQELSFIVRFVHMQIYVY